MKKRKSIVSPYGNVGVDSGQLLIIDPCYLEMFMKKYSYEDICEHPQGNMVYPKGHITFSCFFVYTDFTFFIPSAFS